METVKTENILLPRSKWYPAKQQQRFTSGDLLNKKGGMWYIVQTIPKAVEAQLIFIFK
jgi:hypothetical protein